MSSQDNELRLYHSPTDSISSLSFNSNGSHLLCSSWDSKLRVYDVDKLEVSTDFQSHAPLLDAVYENDDYAWSGGLGEDKARILVENWHVSASFDQIINCKRMYVNTLR